MQFTDPIAFEEFLATTGSETRTRPLTGSRFRASLKIRSSQRVRMFTIDAGSFWLQKAPQHEHYSLNFPLNVPVAVYQPGYEQIFGPSSAFISSPGLPITYTAQKNSTP
jgi:hypothetical protein